MADKHEPMADEDMTKLRETLAQYYAAIASKSVTPAGIPTHLWIADDIVSQAVEPLLAEVDRLRAENQRLIAERDARHQQVRWRNARIDDLQSQVDAMRPIVEAVANHADNSYGVCLVCGFDSDDHGPGCPAEQARVFIAAHPAEA